MAKPVSYQEIEKKLSVLKEGVSEIDIPYVLLGAFGTTDTYIKRYKEGKGIVSKFDGLLVKDLLAYRQVPTQRLTSELEALKTDAVVLRAKPRLFVVSDGISLLAYDPKERETYDNKVKSLWLDFAFFYPLAGIERYRGVEENPADVKAAEKMAKLHDEIRRYNEYSSSSDLHDLNIFMTRLLFCFFAEDTGIFEENLFTGSICRYTQEDGSDLSTYLDACFNVMDKDVRLDIPSVISQFPYVNGGLFHKQIAIPRMGRRARKLIIECGELNWKDINPDIFGSMIQAVVTPDQRGSLGMHYTSVPNIMKVIQPLFLDELYAAYSDIPNVNPKEEPERARNAVKKLKALLLRISRMKFFDPACGSGNFLIIAYKELRRLEIQLWKQITRLSHGQVEIPFVNILLSQFYGIEIDDFAHEVAMLSLWLAEHQMNCLFTHEFAKVKIPALPLRANGNIRLGNACRIEWEEVCPYTQTEEVFVFGNPPYLGSKLQSKEQKADIEYVFAGLKNSKILDYIANWFFLASQFAKGCHVKYAFVSTNSICQGEQVSVLWPQIFKNGQEIDFAYTSFKWSNKAKHNAGVTVVIIGVCGKNERPKALYHQGKKHEVVSINPYLSVGNKTIVFKQTQSPSGLPKICFGCMPYDGGFLLFNQAEYDSFVNQYPQDVHFLRRIYGSEEFINDIPRYCLWIDDEDLNEALQNPEILRRIEQTKAVRLKSTDKSGRKLAEKPHQFREHPLLDVGKIIIPCHSSENREYIPMGYLFDNAVISNAAFVIYNAPIWFFGILTSKMHMAWVKAVGGRLKTDYRYSAQLCYNTFPFPAISEEKQQAIEQAAEEVLLCREDHPDKTLADLYDPDRMPENLKEAHCVLDALVDGCYRAEEFRNDEERLEVLFGLYEEMNDRRK